MMKMQVDTKITTLIDIDTFATEHAAEVEAEPGIPESVARAAAVGACRALLKTLGHEEIDTALVDRGTEEVAPLVIPSAELKMLREALSRAQTAIGITYPSDARERDLAQLGRLIVEIDRHRPLGSDGKHGDLHTPTCGCEDR